MGSNGRIKQNRFDSPAIVQGCTNTPLFFVIASALETVPKKITNPFSQKKAHVFLKPILYILRGKVYSVPKSYLYTLPKKNVVFPENGFFWNSLLENR